MTQKAPWVSLGKSSVAIWKQRRVAPFERLRKTGTLRAGYRLKNQESLCPQNQ